MSQRWRPRTGLLSLKFQGQSGTFSHLSRGKMIRFSFSPLFLSSQTSLRLVSSLTDTQGEGSFWTYPPDVSLPGGWLRILSTHLGSQGSPHLTYQECLFGEAVVPKRFSWTSLFLNWSLALMQWKLHWLLNYLHASNTLSFHKSISLSIHPPIYPSIHSIPLNICHMTDPGVDAKIS